jgi:Cys-rich repeat protein
MKAIYLTAVAGAVLLLGCECGQTTARCKDQSDCVDSLNKYCAAETQACVECLEDAHCLAGSVCNAEGRCEAGCRGDADRCALGSHCKPDAGCVECVDDAQCGPGRVCNPLGGTCVPGCSTSQLNCPVGQVCNADAGQCVACTVGADCRNPALPVCNPQTQTCVECLDGRECVDPTRPVCATSSGVCVGCLGDSQCAGGTVCTGNVCVPGCSATQPCPAAQVCNPVTSQCVGCLDDSHCPAAGAPRCDPTANRCFQCLPGPSDSCPTGQYCRTDKVCEQGCKVHGDCPSGQCRDDHSCSTCIGDAHCAAGRVCSSGTCIEACSTTAPCGTGKSCCGGHCVDAKVDPSNCGGCNIACSASQSCCGGACTGLQTPTSCGACGVTCSTNQACCSGACKPVNSLSDCGGCGISCKADQFCDGTSCRDQIFPEFCANRKVYAILDGHPLDDAATGVLVSTIRQNCSAQTQVLTGPQTNASWIDQRTGALLLGGGSTVVIAGGPYPSVVVRWLEQTRKATKVYVSSNNLNTWYFRRRADDAIIVSKTEAYCAQLPRKDVFLVELVTDPTSGTLALVAYGLCMGGYGTQTGAWYWANVMLPHRNQYPDSWYLVEWADKATGTGQGPGANEPDAADTFTILAHGR